MEKNLAMLIFSTNILANMMRELSSATFRQHIKKLIVFNNSIQGGLSKCLLNTLKIRKKMLFI